MNKDFAWLDVPLAVRHAFDDLSACIAPSEYHDLEPETQQLVGDYHTWRHHPELEHADSRDGQGDILL